VDATYQGNLSAHPKFASLPEWFWTNYAIFRDTITSKNTSYKNMITDLKQIYCNVL